MGILIGLFFGLGLILIVQTFTKDVKADDGTPHRPGLSEKAAELLAEAGIENVTPGQLLFSCVATGVVVFSLLFLVTGGVITVAAIFGLFAGYLPFMLVRMRARGRRTELRELWPDVVDNLASSVRAGLSLAEGLSQIGHRGPEALRRPFQRFNEDYRATGRFNDCLDQLKARLADPTGDRIVESLRVAREVGGSDLGRLLRTLSQFLREESRTRGELESRQSFTVNSARVAVAAPWLILFLMSFNPNTIAAYNSVTGFIVLMVGTGLSILAYRIMVRIGRLPEERRVLR